MDDDLIIIVDFENICRLCLHSTGVMSNIFDTYGEKSLRKQILSITGLPTREGDGLPSKICHRCRHIVQQASDLRDVVDKSRKILAKTAHAKVPRKVYGKRPPAELTCQLCLCQFATQEEVRKHVEAHYAGSNLEIYLDYHSRLCTFCDEMQLNKPQLVKHHRLHLGINPYVCRFPGCSYEGKDRDGIRHHSVVHEARSRVCASCGAAFRRRSDLVSHMSRLHPRAAQVRLSSRVCALCGLRSRDEPALRRHMQAHHYAPRFPCPYGSCSRGYRSRHALQDHELAHRGERRYRCPRCHRAHFASVISLKRHIKTHDSSLMTECDKCPATFEEFGAFYRHRIAHHEPWPPHYCRACYQGHQSESQLKKHEQTCERLQHKNEQTDTQHVDTEQSMKEESGDVTEIKNDEVSQEEVLYLEMKEKEETDEEDGYTWHSPH